MKKYILPLFFLIGMMFCFTGQTKAQSTVTLDSTVLEIDTISMAFSVPWEIIWGPDEWLWITEREGLVSRLNYSTGTKDVILDITSTVHEEFESGLLGLALHPEFPDSNYVYIAYTFSSGGIKERMVRYEYDGTDLVNPFTMIDNIPGNTTHDGSRLMFLADGTLLMTTGDVQNTSAPQNISSMNGKYLRFNYDGTVPADNPISGSHVYTWGHRNSQGICIGPGGAIYSSEHGPTSDDELNIIMVGRNYGWPNVEGLCDNSLGGENTFCVDSNVVEPLVAWMAGVPNSTIAPSDLIYYDSPAIPEWENTLLMTVLKNKHLRRITLNVAGDAVTDQTEFLNNSYGRMRDICVTPDGTIYIATGGSSWPDNGIGHTIIRVRNQALILDREDNPLLADEFIKVFPNPATGQFSAVFSDGFVEENWELVDMQGRVVKSGLVEQNRQEIHIESVAKGLYFLKAANRKGGELVESVIVK